MGFLKGLEKKTLCFVLWGLLVEVLKILSLALALTLIPLFAKEHSLDPALRSGGGGRGVPEAELQGLLLGQ